MQHITDLKTVLARLGHELLLISESSCRDVSDDLKRIMLAGGKRLRPSLAYLAYSIGTEPKLPILPLMAMIELMHTASLIHDDIVDCGTIRRGVQTINEMSGNRKAVQAADQLLAKAMEYLHIYKGTGINEKLAAVSELMCTGEFLQLDMVNGKLPVTKENYFRIIHCKTAAFISEAARCGGIAAGLDKNLTNALAEYGENIGMAFQLKDDLLDVSGGKNYLKQTGQDKKRGIKTAPDLFGTEETKAKVCEYSKKAVYALEPVNGCTAKNMLVKMAQCLCARDR